MVLHINGPLLTFYDDFYGTIVSFRDFAIKVSLVWALSWYFCEEFGRINR